MVDLNATQAAIRAGYSERTAYSIGHENLRKPEIQKAIRGRQENLAKNLEITQQMVINGLYAEANFHGEGASHSARISAWGLLAKHLGMLIDRKIIGIKRLEDMGDDELRQIAGEVLEELDAQVTVDGNVGPVVAELLPPRQDTRDGDNATRIATLDDIEPVEPSDINELDGSGN